MKDVHPLEEPSLLKAIRRRPLVFAACTLAGLALGVGAASRSADTYSGSSAVTVEDPRLTSLFVGSPALDAKRYVADQVQVLQSPQVLQLAAAALDGKAWGPITYDDVVAGLSVQGADTSNTITVSFAAATADLATAGTDAVVDAYIAVATDNAELAESKSVAELQTQVAAVDAQVSQIDQEIAALQVASAGAPGSSRDVRLDAALSQRNGLLSERSALSARSRQLAVDLARNPSGVTRRTTAFATEVPSGAARFGFLGLLLGGVLGTVLTYRLARRRRRFESVREPETVLGVQFLAAIPARGQGPTTAPLERSREAVMEFLATFIEAEARRSGLQRVGFVSPSASIELGHLGSGLQRTLAMERSDDDSVLRSARVTLSGGEQRASDAQDEAADGGVAPLGVASGANGSNGTGARRLPGNGVAELATAAVHSEGGALVTEAVAGGDVGGRRAAVPARQPSTETAERAPELDTLSAPSVVAGPPNTSLEQSESLVLVEIPRRGATSGASAAQDSIDAIVLVLDANESIAAAAEVTRRVQVLGWNLLGYVYVTGSRPR